jgi:hypothetical protein
MTKIVLIFTFLILTTNLFAQECEYAEYNSLIDSALKNYNNKDFKEAEIKLKLAFTKTDFPHGQDLNLALLVAQKRKDAEWAEQISIKLAKGGVPLRYFEKLKTFKWHEKFKNDFKIYSDYYIENFKPELRERLNSLLKLDIETNLKYHQWRTRKIEMSLQELIDEASRILTDFQKLTDEYGFPNERLMGYNYVRRLNTVERYNVEVLIIHIHGRGELVFKDDIHEIVCKGGLNHKYEEEVKNMRGFGDGTGIEQEMKARYKKYRGKE